MLKKYSQVVSVLFAGIFGLFVTSASAIDLDEATRTVVQDGAGKTIVLTPEQVKRGKRLFNATCGACHLGGITKTNPNVGLDPEALSLATPRRDNIDGLVDFLKDPTTYDGIESIAEVHPSIRSADIYPRMRSVTDEDLTAISGHILLQPKIITEKIPLKCSWVMWLSPEESLLMQMHYQ
jgi:photosystem II cytochrome c550